MITLPPSQIPHRRCRPHRSAGHRARRQHHAGEGTAGDAIDGGHFLADEVIEFTTPDKPFYWGFPGRGGIVGNCVYIGHPAIEGGRYQVISIQGDESAGGYERAEGLSRKYWVIPA